MNEEEFMVRVKETLEWVEATYEDIKPIPVDAAYVGHWQHPTEENNGGLLLLVRTQDAGKSIQFQLDKYSSSMVEACVKDIRSRLQTPVSQMQEDLENEQPIDILQ